MQLSVIIVNYNVKYFLEHCLLSVLKACKGIEAEVFVADNNSTDGSREYLEPKFPTVKFFWNRENTGFAKANNSVLSQTNGEHILFLNPDTIVPEDCFSKCLSFFKTHNDCGALGVRMIDGSGNFLKESKRSLPTPSSGFFKMTGLEKLFPNSPIFAGYYAGKLPETENNKAEVLSGAFMMLSQKAADKTKGFDEDFFMYGEDIDLSYRILKSGVQNYYLGEITIIHFKGESTQKRSPEYFKNFYGSVKLFIDKHYRSEKIKHALMTKVISCGKIIAQNKKYFSFVKPAAPSATILKTLVMCSEDQLESINKIISDTPYDMHHLIYTGHDFTISEMKNIILKKSIAAVILCENISLSYKVMIDWLQQIPDTCQCLFFADNAGSITGSHNKNERGIVIAAR